MNPEAEVHICPCCEAEFSVVVYNVDEAVHHCPFCGTLLDDREALDIVDDDE